MTKAVIKRTIEIELDIDTAAQWFAEISDDDMARFFCAVAEKVKHWPAPSFSPDFMWALVGQHLAECACSTDDGREMIRAIAGHMEHYLTKRAQAA